MALSQSCASESRVTRDRNFDWVNFLTDYSVKPYLTGQTILGENSQKNVHFKEEEQNCFFIRPFSHSKLEICCVLVHYLFFLTPQNDAMHKK